MRSADNDRNLLFGLLALQLDFISHDALLKAVGDWVQDRARSLGEILVEQRALTADRHVLLEALVREHLKQHGGDPAQSLAALSSIGPLRDELKQLADSQLEASLARVGVLPVTLVAPASAPHPPASAAPAPSASRFRILKLHAKGGLGQVSVALDEELNREVALKEIQDRYAADTDARGRFIREAEITGGLEHPGIVPVYGLGTYADGRPYYAMRFIKGDSLQEAVARFHQAERPNRDPGERAVELRKLLGRFIDVCNAIAYAHSRGVLHRDLKPGNIMLGQYGETLVVDWGLAKPVERAEDVPSTERPLTPASVSGSAATQMGAVVGTPAYMSPEQAGGRLDQVGQASDVYSLGATLYCLLTNNPPFQGSDVTEVLLKVQRGDFPRPRQVKPEVPAALEAVCLKAMALEARNRYVSPRALADDVERWLADEPVAALPETRGQRLARWFRRHRTWAQAGVAALLLVAVVAIIAAIVVSSAWQAEQQARQKESNERERADAKAKEAREQRDRALELQKKTEQFAAELALDRGRGLCDQGEARRGLLWMAQALRLAPDEAEDLRAQIRLNLRNWYSMIGPLRQVLPQRGAVVGVAFSRDGKSLTAFSGEAIERWDVLTGKPAGATIRLDPPVGAAAMSRDGTMAVTGTPMPLFGNGFHGEARLWHLNRDDPVGARLGPKVHGVGSVAFSPDGKSVATAIDNAVQVWEVPSGKAAGIALEHPGQVRSLAFSPDGKSIVTGCFDTAVRVWDVATGKVVGEALKHPNVVEAIAFSADGKRMATGCQDQRIHLWEMPGGKETGQPLEHPQWVRALAFSPDGKWLASASGEFGWLWEVSSGALHGPPLPHRGEVQAVAFSPNGKTVVTAGVDATVRMWELPEAPARGEPVQDEGKPLELVAVSPDLETVLTREGETTYRLRKLTDGKPLSSPLQAEAAQLPSGTFSPDGKWVAVSFWLKGSKVRVWTVPDGKLVGMPLDLGPVMELLFSPDGKVAVTRSEDNLARLWEMPAGRAIGKPLDHQKLFTGFALSPDGKVLATGGADGVVRLWEVPAGKESRTLPTQRGVVRVLQFSPDGKLLATASSEGQVNLWEVSGGEPACAPLVHEKAVVALAFSPNGRLLATASFDNTARLWTVPTGKAVGLPLEHPKAIIAVAFSQDGKTIATGSEDGTARLWSTASGKSLAPSMPLGERVLHVAFLKDGKAVLTVGESRRAGLWKVYGPLTGEPDQIQRWADAITGLELDENGAFQVLSASAWQERLRLLKEAGSPRLD